MVLKFVDDGDFSGATANLASTSPADFLASHIVEPSHEFVFADELSRISLQRLAGGDDARWQMLASLSGFAEMTVAIPVITTSLFAEWNPSPRAEGRTAADLMGHRARSRLAVGSDFERWAQREIGAAVTERPWVTFGSVPTRRFPNPFFVARSSLADTSTTALLGNSHGDLHVENVFLPVESFPAPSKFVLIDLDTFSSSDSLAIDPANLLLSEIERAIVLLRPSHRERLLDLLINRDSPIPTELVGIVELWDKTVEATLDLATERGFGSEWSQQWWFALAGSAVMLASRERLDHSTRIWFFSLASVALSKFFYSRPDVTYPDGDTVRLDPVLDDRQRAAAAATDAVVEASTGFDGRSLTIALIAPGSISSWSTVSLVGAGWDLVIDFDRLAAEEGGSFRSAVSAGAPIRLVQPGQSVSLSRGSTVWVAAAGLVPPGSPDEQSEGYREWRSKNHSGLAAILASVATSVAGPIRLNAFGVPDARSRAVVEALLDAAEGRVSLTVISADHDAGALTDHSPQTIDAEPNLVAGGFPGRPANPDDPRILVTLPAGDGTERVTVAEEDRRWLEDGFELLHSQVALYSNAVEGVAADFYGGRRITWFELDSHVDLPRTDHTEALERALRTRLSRRRTDRYIFQHRAGAGGTTIVRRVMWNLHNEYPVLLTDQIVDVAQTASRIQKLASLTERQVVVVIEGTPATVIDKLHDLLRSSSVPVLLIVVARSYRGPSTRTRTDSSNEVGELTRDEQRWFASFFSNLGTRDGLRSELNQIGRPGGEAAVPFMYALTTFGHEFTGLRAYVQRFLADVEPALRPVLITIAIAHRFGGVDVHSSLFASELRLPIDAPVRLATRLGDTVNGLLIEATTARWRTTHLLVAEEILSQTLRPLEGPSADDPDAWYQQLPSWAEKIVELARIASPGFLTRDVEDLLVNLFIRRELDREGDRQRYSELISSMTAEGRERVFSKLVQTFPDQPHFWAHRARFYSADARDHELAQESMEKALEIDDSDPLIWHMGGINRRARLYDLLEASKYDEAASLGDMRARIEEIANLALGDFNQARVLENYTSEYPLTSSAELALAVIEWAKKVHRHETYAALLRAPGSAFYNDLYDVAVLSLELIEELEGDDQPSQSVERIRARLKGVQDNYGAMLEGWRNMLETATGSRLAIRTRLAALYGMRNGAWHRAPSTDITSALQLLNENLADNPNDPRTARTWLAAARHGGATLERAAEVVSNWVEYDDSRDALYADYVVDALRALGGRLSSVAEYERKRDVLRSRTFVFRQRRAIYDWLGKGTELRQLVHRSEVADWDRSSDADPPQLARVTGRVEHIHGPASGILRLANGVEAFFVPSVANLVADRDLNATVTCLLGFSYDGIQAWTVKRADPA